MGQSREWDFLLRGFLIKEVTYTKWDNHFKCYYLIVVKFFYRLLIPQDTNHFVGLTMATENQYCINDAYNMFVTNSDTCICKF